MLSWLFYSLARKTLLEQDYLLVVKLLLSFARIWRYAGVTLLGFDEIGFRACR